MFHSARNDIELVFFFFFFFLLVVICSEFKFVVVSSLFRHNVKS